MLHNETVEVWENSGKLSDLLEEAADVVRGMEEYVSIDSYFDTGTEEYVLTLYIHR